LAGLFYLAVRGEHLTVLLPSQINIRTMIHATEYLKGKYRVGNQWNQ
jgi:hypothetical protein